MGKPKQESGDAEMAAINKQRDDMVRAGMIEGIGRENYDIIMDIHSVKGKPGKNVPGGLIISKRIKLKRGGKK
jgi:hypothetical protein